MQANTSTANILRSSPAQSSGGVLSFLGSYLAPASGATLASSAPAWGRVTLFSSAPAWGNSGPELWQMTRTFQPGQLQGWVLYKGGEVSAKGFHGQDALSVEPTELAPPTVKAIGSTAGAE